MRARRLARLVVFSALGWVACSSDDPTGPKQCVPACDPATQACDTATGRCVAKAPLACSSPCGAAAYCAAGACQLCSPGTSNCDGDDSSCECAGTCDGAGCNAAPPCSPTAASCTQETYCDGSACVPCAAPTLFNCDRIGACECEQGCDGASCAAASPCDPAVAGSCGSASLHCDDTGCVACTGTSKNCNGDNADKCECAEGCDGTSCATAPDTTPCGDLPAPCDAATQICVIYSDTGGDGFACKDVPTTCLHDRTCACLSETLCPDWNACSHDTANNTINCQE